MSKSDQLKGVANNLADSIISPTNMEFLKYIESLPEEKTRNMEIDLLEKIMKPDEIKSEKTEKVIDEYKKWFIKQMKNIGISIEDIEKVIVKITHRAPGKMYGRSYGCSTTIIANGKEYIGKNASLYSS